MDSASNDEEVHIDQLRADLARMKAVLEETKLAQEKKSKSSNNTIINGNIMSGIFLGVLCMVVGVATFSFYNLYAAITKRYSGHHTEL